MSSTLIEQLRADQEEIEHLERAIVKALFLKAQDPSYVVLADFMIKQFLEEIQTKSVEALSIYQDQDGLKKLELQFLEGLRDDEKATSNKSLDIWTNFYEKVAGIKNYHKKYSKYGEPAQIKDDNWYFLHALDDKTKIPKFSGPEGNGRFVDLHGNYLEFVNLKKLQKHKPRVIHNLDYVSYLATFDQFHEVPLVCKDQKYKSYLENLLAYLKDFFNRTQPLFSIEKLEQQHLKEFQPKWEDRKLSGWEKVPKQDKLNQNSLYCVPCKKLFTNSNVFKAHKSGTKHKKAVERIAEILEQPEEETEDIKKYREVAYLESFITHLRETLGDTIEDTMNNIRKKQTRTANEYQAELDDNEEEDLFLLPIEQIKEKAEKKQKSKEYESSDDEKPVYNPRNLPLGYDGKPIPYWLYKLNGLNIEYKCEICGNYSYWGRRAFERHFSEWRHAYGMRCLRIPNTMHFREITKIQEAIELHKKLIRDHETDQFNPEEEEFEDSQGNVLTAKKFSDLQKQGLL